MRARYKIGTLFKGIMKMAFAKTMKGKLTSATLAIGLTFGGAAAAIADETGHNNPDGSGIIAAQQQEMPAPATASCESITSDEALERSAGKIVLHYGEGYSQSDIESLERVIENMVDIEVELYAGGQDNSIEFYFFQNKIPKVFTFENSTQIAILAEAFAKKYNLGRYAQASNDLG